ncbi:MAG TPA: 30S ribosomal protein S3 [Candidatus Dojkabacteria bacterium]|mgnify:CR=1 FL=1|nr:30S ribosomal protein S3 [Candidatus Dojkabacteria bacterium]
MGTKMNATAMRLGVSKGWKSSWYATGKQYEQYLHEDIAIHDLVAKKVKSAGLAGVNIRRASGKVIITMKVARPGVVIGRQGSGIETLKQELKSIVKEEIDLRIKEVESVETNARIIANNIVEGIEKRQAPKLLANAEINKAMQAGAKGVMIWVSGRIRGQKDARRLKFIDGSVPLQTIRADIDYACEVAQYPNAGKTSVKVWVHK